jgi:hypothetical protein
VWEALSTQIAPKLTVGRTNCPGKKPQHQEGLQVRPLVNRRAAARLKKSAPPEQARRRGQFGSGRRRGERPPVP